MCFCWYWKICIDMKRLKYIFLNMLVTSGLILGSDSDLFELDISLNNLSSMLRDSELVLRKVATSGGSVEYDLGDIRFRLIKKNILDIPADAIVNAANQNCLGGGGIDGVITKAGGIPLATARENIPEIDAKTGFPKPGSKVRCPTGQSRVTVAGNLKQFKYILHSVGPVCSNGCVTNENKQQLAQTYVNTIRRAQAFNANPKDPGHIEFSKVDSIKFGSDYRIKSITFPTISSGIFGCNTKDTASSVVAAIVDYFKSVSKIESDKGLQIIQFAFYDPVSSEKADSDFVNYKSAFDAVL